MRAGIVAGADPLFQDLEEPPPVAVAEQIDGGVEDVLAVGVAERHGGDDTIDRMRAQRRFLVGLASLVAVVGCGEDAGGPADAAPPPVDGAAGTPDAAETPVDAGAPAPDAWQPPAIPCDYREELTGGFACAVAPSTTGEGILDDFDWHAIGVPDGVGPATPIVIWFKGAAGRPFDPALMQYPGSSLVILEEAVSRGFLVLMIAYDREPNVSEICGEDRACYGPARREVIEGVEAGDPDPAHDVRPPNDIFSRVDALLTYLLAAAPDRFPAVLDWPTVTVGGHSLGAGHAGFIAKELRPVRRVCLMAGLGDGSSDGQPADWIVSPARMTPLEATRGLIHAMDPWYFVITQAWAALGMEQDVHWRRRTDATANPHNFVVQDPAASADRIWACFE